MRTRGTRGVYDFVVVGGGSAGFNAAREAVGLGLRTAVVDGARRLGGLCILRGCMPSKTLLYTAEVLHRARRGEEFGLKIPEARANMRAVHARKRRIIREFADYRAKQIATSDFDLFRSAARFTDPGTLELADGRRIRGRRFLIATGSRVTRPNITGMGAVRCWTSDDILDLDRIPKSVVVLGGGVVACELAQFLVRIGTRVTLIQRGRNILRDHSPEASAVLQKVFVREGIELHVGTRIQSVRQDRSGVTVSFSKGRKNFVVHARHCLNALGREAATGRLNLGAAGVDTRPNGQVIINRWQQTSAPHIYAAGDCSGPVEIVHVAIQQGILAARHAAGKQVDPIDYGLLLNVVFTEPALATIGRLEGELAAAKTPFLSASYPFDDHGKSILMGAVDGYVKVLAEPKRGRILGAEIVGPDAGELIHVFSGALAMRATVFDLLKAPWYHPTLSEIVTYPLEEIAEQVSRRKARRRS